MRTRPSVPPLHNGTRVAEQLGELSGGGDLVAEGRDLLQRPADLGGRAELHAGSGRRYEAAPHVRALGDVGGDPGGFRGEPPPVRAGVGQRVELPDPGS